LFIATLVRGHQKIIGILVRVRIQVNKHSFFLALAIEEELNVLVEIAPFLAMSGLFTTSGGGLIFAGAKFKLDSLLVVPSVTLGGKRLGGLCSFLWCIFV
jgi:hypothetical protein